MYRILASAVGACCLLMTSTVDAQWVRVGPFGGVSVRAPFVRVDAVPGGGARVRAPFTAVNTGVFAYDYGPVYRPYRYYYPPPVYYDPVPVYPVPVYPSPVYPQVIVPEASIVPPASRYQVARPPITMDATQIATQLRASAQRLHRSLSQRRDDGDVWLNYLAPNQIIETIDRGGPADSLRQLLLNYDGVVGNASLASIRGASGFGETHRLLRQFIQSGAAVQTPTAPTPSPAADQADAIPVPAPDPPETESDEPTPAQRVRPAEGGDEDEQAEQKAEPERTSL